VPAGWNAYPKGPHVHKIDVPFSETRVIVMFEPVPFEGLRIAEALSVQNTMKPVLPLGGGLAYNWIE
jgi:hypothetical protein